LPIASNLDELFRDRKPSNDQIRAELLHETAHRDTVPAMAHAELDLLVVGEINADLLVTGHDVEPVFGQVEKLVERATLAVGSSSVITACAAARLGLRTAFAGVVGDDAIGHFMLDALKAHGVDVRGCRVDAALDTGVSILLVDASSERGRAILTAPGAMTALEAGDVDAHLLAAARHVHCGGYFLQPGLQAGLPDLFAAARRAGATCSLDPNWDPAGTWDAGIREAIAQCDVFLPNEAELLRIAGKDDVDAALDELAHPALTVAVKQGGDGAEWRRGDHRLRLPAPAVDVVDTTGAGDAFDAGLLHAFLAGAAPEEQLALAVACGALSTRALGGVDAQPDLAEAARLAASLDPNGSRI
jgi:sugar/nucleoside kinase (ribokinase family)